MKTKKTTNMNGNLMNTRGFMNTRLDYLSGAVVELELQKNIDPKLAEILYNFINHVQFGEDCTYNGALDKAREFQAFLNSTQVVD